MAGHRNILAVAAFEVIRRNTYAITCSNGGAKRRRHSGRCGPHDVLWAKLAEVRAWQYRGRVRRRKLVSETVQQVDVEALRANVRDIPDFPQPGILFRDITPLLADAPSFRAAVDAMAAPFAGVSVVVAI